MNRFVVAAIAVTALGAFFVQEASALSAKNRLCVQTARRQARDSLRETRLKLLDQQRKDIAACFGTNSGCAERCQNLQTTCLDDKVDGPRATCDRDPQNPSSCRSKFDANTKACLDNVKKLPDGQIDYDDLLACQARARTARFTCSQACALGVQKAQDDCGIDYSDCLELCG